MLTQTHARDRIIGLSNGSQPIPPKQPTRIVGSSLAPFDLHQLHISNAGAGRGPADWVVNDIEIDGRSQLEHKNLPGALFGRSGVGSVCRSSSHFAFDGFEVVEQGKELAITVTYVGPNPEGVSFHGVAIGSEPFDRPLVIPIASKGLFKPLPRPIAGARGTRVVTTTDQAMTIRARPLTAPFRLERIEIDEVAADWLVHDIKVNGRSQFAQAGDVPGDMFAPSVTDNFVSFETCLTDNPLEIWASYIGDKPEGARFSARLIGTFTALVGADPSEQRASVSVASEEGAEEVVAKLSPRRRSQDEGSRAAVLRETDPVGFDMIDQCSTLVMSTPLKRTEEAVIETRLVPAEDSRAGRVLAFFVATKGKRALISMEAAEKLIQIDKSV